MFQSLLHQGISLLHIPDCVLHALVQMFQSLLHQGISLLASLRQSRTHFRSPGVSIPSSSGHQFTGSRNRTVHATAKKKFQSLLHQGISLLRPGGDAGRTALGQGFNPFFIRASVYWQKVPPRTCGKETALFQSLLHQGISLLGVRRPRGLRHG